MLVIGMGFFCLYCAGLFFVILKMGGFLMWDGESCCFYGGVGIFSEMFVERLKSKDVCGKIEI